MTDVIRHTQKWSEQMCLSQPKNEKEGYLRFIELLKMHVLKMNEHRSFVLFVRLPIAEFTRK